MAERQTINTTNYTISRQQSTIEYLAAVGLRSGGRSRLARRDLQAITVSVEPTRPPDTARSAPVLSKTKIELE